MKFVILSLFASVVAQAATDTYNCTTDTNKSVFLEIDNTTVQSLKIDGGDYTDLAHATLSRGIDGVRITVKGYKDGKDLFLGMGKQVYQLGSGSERTMKCALTRGQVRPRPDDGL